MGNKHCIRRNRILYHAKLNIIGFPFEAQWLFRIVRLSKYVKMLFTRSSLDSSENLENSRPSSRHCTGALAFVEQSQSSIVKVKLGCKVITIDSVACGLSVEER